MKKIIIILILFGNNLYSNYISNNYYYLRFNDVNLYKEKNKSSESINLRVRYSKIKYIDQSEDENNHNLENECKIIWLKVEYKNKIYYLPTYKDKKSYFLTFMKCKTFHVMSNIEMALDSYEEIYNEHEKNLIYFKKMRYFYNINELFLDDEGNKSISPYELLELNFIENEMKIDNGNILYKVIIKIGNKEEIEGYFHSYLGYDHFENKPFSKNVIRQSDLVQSNLDKNILVRDDWSLVRENIIEKLYFNEDGSYYSGNKLQNFKGKYRIENNYIFLENNKKDNIRCKYNFLNNDIISHVGLLCSEKNNFFMIYNLKKYVPAGSIREFQNIKYKILPRKNPMSKKEYRLKKDFVAYNTIDKNFEVSDCSKEKEKLNITLDKEEYKGNITLIGKSLYRLEKNKKEDYYYIVSDLFKDNNFCGPIWISESDIIFEKDLKNRNYDE